MIKRITLLGLAVMACFAVKAQVVFEEDFTGTAGSNGTGSLTNLGWSVYEQDGAQVNPQVNFLNEPWKIVKFSDVGEGMVTSSWFANGQTQNADRWAVTPAIELPEVNPTLIYKVLNGDPGSPEAYEILVSTTGNSPDDFGGAIFEEDPAPSGSGSDLFANRTVSLEDFAGETVYIAFRSVGNDGYLLVVDDIVVAGLVENDIALTNIQIPNYTLMSNDEDIKVTVKNVGLNTVNNATIEWTDGVNTYSDEYTLNLDVYESTEVTLNTPFNSSTSDEKVITVTAVEVNGGEDADPSDNEISTTVSMVSQLIDKAVVIEEGTGTWCGWCPRGFVAMDHMYDNPDQFPNFIGIGVHNNDPMAFPEYDGNNGISAFPGANVDRVMIGAEVGVAEWEAYYADRSEVVTPVDLEMEVGYDKASRDLTVTVNTTSLADFSNANFRLGLVVVEDEVTGTGSGWGQSNYYSGGGSGPMGGWESLPSTVSGYAYDRVGRDLIGGYFGEEGSVPTQLNDGETYSYEFTYSMPSDFDAQNVSIVALFLNANNGEIVNATEESLYVLGVEDHISSNFTMYPNPATDVINVSFAAEMSGKVQMNIYNMAGQVVQNQVFNNIVPGESLQVNVDGLASGEYLVSFATPQGAKVKKLIVK